MDDEPTELSSMTCGIIHVIHSYMYSGSVDGNNQLIIKGKFQQKQIETVLRRYISKSIT